jgi:hypothetical protein
LPPTYQPIADKALTDELYGGATYNEGWVGWEGKDGEFVIDLGEEMIVETVEADFLHKLGAWIFLPRSVSCSVSTDNLNYKFVEKITIEENREGSVKYVRIPLKMKEPGKVRYIKLYIESVGLCPPWHYGVGYPGWFFLDEVNVY